jgi:alkanesulfonate monooxygenase SsuD/methylene tetrahydromethanopterin reductase-like flavin-dependent oxidoreductase (luciferase family)
MTDYGHGLEFGALLEPPEGRPEEVVRLAEVMEEVGLDTATLSDHPYWPERLDTTVLLSAILSRTSTLRLMTNCANLPLRPPALLARTASTLDVLSSGRFDLGLAAGAQPLWDGILAEGGPRRTAGESIEALEEAVEIIRALWAPGPDYSFAGKHYHVTGARRGPVPVHDMGIWLGAYQPRMLRLTGRVADGWIPSSPSMTVESYRTANKIIDETAHRAGRNPEAIRRAYNIEGEFSAAKSGFLHGPPSVWAEQLAQLTLTEGVSAYFLYRASSEKKIRTFAEEVVPAVREMVRTERN